MGADIYKSYIWYGAIIEREKLFCWEKETSILKWTEYPSRHFSKEDIKEAHITNGERHSEQKP